MSCGNGPRGSGHHPLQFSRVVHWSYRDDIKRGGTMSANPPVTKVARRILRFTKPWDQLLIVLPTLTSMAFISLVSYTVLVHVRMAALQAFSDMGAASAITQRFETEVSLFLFIY